MKALGILAGGLAAAIASMLALGSGGGSYRVRAEFADAAGLRVHSQVKVGGVAVGRVESMAVTPRNAAIVTLSLSDTRIGEGASAYIRPVNLLGEKYVDLQPGGRGRTLPSGTLLPPSRTGTPVELDQVLDTLDASTRVRLEMLIDAGGQALAGRGTDLGSTLAALPRALDQARAMVGSFAADNQTLGRLVVVSDRLIRTMARRRHALGALVTTTGRALDAVASRDQQLAGTIQTAAPTVAQLRATLVRLDGTAAALRPAANGLRASAPGLASTLQALPGFAAAARPTLAEARSVAPTLTRLGVEATPVVTRLRPVAQRLQQFSDAFGPVTTTFDRGIGDLLGFIEGWARAIQVGDGGSHMFRNQLVLSPEIVARLGGYLHPAAKHHSTPDKRRPKTVSTTAVPQLKLPAVGGAIPSVSAHVQQLVQQLTQTLAPAPAASDHVSALLNYLLGR